MRRSLVSLALLAACSSSSSTATRPSGPGAPAPAAESTPELLGKPVWDGTLTDPMALRALERVRGVLADPVPVLEGADPRMWLGPVQTWIERRVNVMRELRADTDALATDADPRMQLLATLVFGIAADDLVGDLLSLQPPAEYTSGEFGQETRLVFHEALEQQAVPVAKVARPALQQCIAAAPAAPAPLRVWEAHCRERDADLAELQARVAARGPAPTKAARPPALFADCDSKESLLATPTALPPDKQVKPAVAYVYQDATLNDAAAIAKLEAAVAAKLGPASGMKVVSARDLAAARTLLRQKKLHAKAPSCGQAPPLSAIVAHKAKHLVIGEITRSCVYGKPSTTSPTCELTVRYWRAGAHDDRDGLPPAMYAPIGAEASASEYLAAVDQLSPQTTHQAALLGALIGSGPEQVFTAFSGTADDDPWLRLPWTLRDDTTAQLKSCVDAGASFDATFTITREGKTKNVKLAPLSAPPEGSTVAACVKKALENTPWPCTRDGKPATVSVRMCVAPKPQ